MLIIPVIPFASQSFNVTLSGKAVRLDIYQRSTGLFANIWLASTMILGGVLCLDRNWLVRSSYFGMPGDLAFADTQGVTDPVYTGLGTRYLLVYAEGENAQ